MEPTGVFFTALVLAFVVEAVLEYVAGIWWKPLANATRSKVMMAFGLVFGVAVCVLYSVDLLAELGLEAGVVGQVITGVIIGRGSEFLHTFYNRLKPK